MEDARASAAAAGHPAGGLPIPPDASPSRASAAKLHLVSIATHMRAHVSVRDRVYRLRVYPNCFVGSDAVTWLAQSPYVPSRRREDAVALGRLLRSAGTFHHVADDHDFADRYLFYRFYVDEDVMYRKFWKASSGRQDGNDMPALALPEALPAGVSRLVERLSEGADGRAAPKLIAAVETGPKQEAESDAVRALAQLLDIAQSWEALRVCVCEAARDCPSNWRIQPHVACNSVGLRLKLVDELHGTAQAMASCRSQLVRVLTCVFQCAHTYEQTQATAASPQGRHPPTVVRPANQPRQQILPPAAPSTSYYRSPLLSFIPMMRRALLGARPSHAARLSSQPAIPEADEVTIPVPPTPLMTQYQKMSRPDPAGTPALLNSAPVTVRESPCGRDELQTILMQFARLRVQHAKLARQLIDHFRQLRDDFRALATSSSAQWVVSAGRSDERCTVYRKDDSAVHPTFKTVTTLPASPEIVLLHVLDMDLRSSWDAGCASGSVTAGVTTGGVFLALPKAQNRLSTQPSYDAASERGSATASEPRDWVPRGTPGTAAVIENYFARPAGSAFHSSAARRRRSSHSDTQVEVHARSPGRAVLSSLSHLLGLSPKQSPADRISRARSYRDKTALAAELSQRRQVLRGEGTSRKSRTASSWSPPRGGRRRASSLGSPPQRAAADGTAHGSASSQLATHVHGQLLVDQQDDVTIASRPSVDSSTSDKPAAGASPASVRRTIAARRYGATGPTRAVVRAPASAAARNTSGSSGSGSVPSGVGVENSPPTDLQNRGSGSDETAPGASNVNRTTSTALGPRYGKVTAPNRLSTESSTGGDASPRAAADDGLVNSPASPRRSSARHTPENEEELLYEMASRLLQRVRGQRPKGKRNAKLPPRPRKVRPKRGTQTHHGGIPVGARFPRILYRHMNMSPVSALLAQRDAVVLQDVALWRDGTIAVYEFSVQHIDVPLVSDAQRCEIMLEGYLLEPVSVPADVYGAASGISSAGDGQPPHKSAVKAATVLGIATVADVHDATAAPGSNSAATTPSGRCTLTRVTRISQINLKGQVPPWLSSSVIDMQTADVIAYLREAIASYGRVAVARPHVMQRVTGLQREPTLGRMSDMLIKRAGSRTGLLRPAKEASSDHVAAAVQRMPDVPEHIVDMFDDSESDNDDEATGVSPIGDSAVSGAVATPHNAENAIRDMFADVPMDTSMMAVATALSPAARAAADAALASYEGTSQTAPGDASAPSSTDAEGVGLADFELLSVLGRGGYGKVMQVRRTRRAVIAAGGEASVRYLGPEPADANAVYAMKILRKKDLVARNQVQRTITERKILTTVRCPFIVGLKYAFQSRTKLYMIMEFVAGGDFFSLLSREGAVSEERAVLYLAELVLALEALHSAGVVYRDLKPENVLLDMEGHVKLTDFGLSRYQADVAEPRSAASASLLGGAAGGEAAPTSGPSAAAYEVSHSFCGTEQYMAPEVLLQRGHTAAVDWWTLGVFASELMTGRHPFRGPNHLSTLRHIVSDHTEPATLRLMSPVAASFVAALLCKDPARRLGSPSVGGIDAVKRHPFFRIREFPTAPVTRLDWERVAARGYVPAFKPGLATTADVSFFDKAFTREAPVDSVASGLSSLLQDAPPGGEPFGDRPPAFSFSQFSYAGSMYDGGDGGYAPPLPLAPPGDAAAPASPDGAVPAGVAAVTDDAASYVSEEYDYELEDGLEGDEDGVDDDGGEPDGGEEDMDEDAEPRAAAVMPFAAPTLAASRAAAPGVPLNAAVPVYPHVALLPDSMTSVSSGLQPAARPPIALRPPPIAATPPMKPLAGSLNLSAFADTSGMAALMGGFSLGRPRPPGGQ